MALKYVQARATTLAVPLTSTETSEIVLRSLVDSYGTQLTFTDFGDLGLMTIAPGTDNEEIVSFGGFTVETNGNVTIDTSITRALLGKSPYGAGGTARSHAAGTEVVFSNNPQMYEALKDYVDGVAIAGAADASATGKGIVEIATSSEIDSETATGSTGAVLAISPDQFGASKWGVDYVTTSSGAGDSGKVAKLDASGGLLASFLNIGLFGDGSDGNVTIAAPTTLARDMYYNNLVVNDVLTTNGYRIFVKGTISGTGTVKTPNGTAGSNGVENSGGAGGAGGTIYSTSGMFVNNAGGDGGKGDNQAGGGDNSATSATAGVNGNIGGNAGHDNGSNVGKSGVATDIFSLLGGMFVSGTFAPYKAASGGGGSSNGSTAAGITSSGGGGGGASGGVVYIAASDFTGTFTISAVGGNGGNGGNNSSSGMNVGNGGEGGAGGSAIIVYKRKTWTGTATLTGGAGGLHGVPTGTPYTTPADGEAGDDGTLYEVNLGSDF